MRAKGLPVHKVLGSLAERVLGTSFEGVIEMALDPRFRTGIVPAANLMASARELGAWYQCLLNEGELDGVFRRTLTLKSKTGSNIDNLWFRAWIGSKVEPKGNDTFLVDDTLTLKFTVTSTPKVRQRGGRAELLVPVNFSDRTATIVEELIW